MRAIQVVDHDPGWPAHFEALRDEICALLGDLVQDVHHIGSTSVPGLAAKPKIDIDAVLRSEAVLAEAVALVSAMAQYTFHGERYGDGMQVFTSGRGSHGARLYLCAPGNATHSKRILFRDWLREHPDDAARYAALKHRLADQAAGDWDFYTGGKSAFVEDIVRKAGSAAARQPTPRRRTICP